MRRCHPPCRNIMKLFAYRPWQSLTEPYRYWQILTDTHRYWQIPTDTDRYWQILAEPPKILTDPDISLLVSIISQLFHISRDPTNRQAKETPQQISGRSKTLQELDESISDEGLGRQYCKLQCRPIKVVENDSEEVLGSCIGTVVDKWQQSCGCRCRIQTHYGSDNQKGKKAKHIFANTKAKIRVLV